MSYDVYLKGKPCGKCGHDKVDSGRMNVAYHVGFQVMVALRDTGSDRMVALNECYPEVPSFRTLNGASASLVAYLLRCVIGRIEDSFVVMIGRMIEKCEENPDAIFIVE